MPDLFGVGMQSPQEDEHARRLNDLFHALYDFDVYPDLYEMEPIWGPKFVRITLQGEQGYNLFIEVKQRFMFDECAFAIIQTGLGLHSPILRLTRRYHRLDWIGKHLNDAHDSVQMRLLANACGFQEPGKTLFLTDKQANRVFGSCCRLFLYGFLS